MYTGVSKREHDMHVVTSVVRSYFTTVHGFLQLGYVGM